MIQEILEIVIKDEKGIEVNTSSHRYGFKEVIFYHSFEIELNNDLLIKVI